MLVGWLQISSRTFYCDVKKDDFPINHCLSQNVLPPAWIPPFGSSSSYSYYAVIFLGHTLVSLRLIPNWLFYRAKHSVMYYMRWKKQIRSASCGEVFNYMTVVLVPFRDVCCRINQVSNFSATCAHRNEAKQMCRQEDCLYEHVHWATIGFPLFLFTFTPPFPFHPITICHFPSYHPIIW